MKNIRIATSEPYDAIIGNGILKDIRNLLRPHIKGNKIAIISDDLVYGLYGESLKNELSKDIEVFSYAFPHGEKSKNIEVLTDILENLSSFELKRDRTSVV